MLELLVGRVAVRPFSAVESRSFPDILRWTDDRVDGVVGRGRHIHLLGSDAVLSDQDSCESLLRKRRISNQACVHDAIFTGTSGKSAPNRDKCRRWSTVGDRSARHFSAYLTRIISKYSWAQHCLIDPRL